jgi:quinol monooxygenase YgiN
MRSMVLMLLAGALIAAGSSGPASAQTPAPPSPPSSEAGPPPAPAAQTPTPTPPAPTPAPAAAGPAASAAAAGPVYVATYFEVIPAGARKAAALLRQFADATRKADGNTELSVLHEIGRPGRFALVEAWKDKAALDAHGAAMKALGDKLQPIFVGPFDARQFVPLAVGAAPAETFPAGAIYVLTHVDVFPQGKDEVTGMIKQLAEDSRKDAGALRFDAVVWDGHANHFHLIEAWTDRKALEAHQAADHTKAFRTKLVPFEGALYDERLYEVVKKTE